MQRVGWKWRPPCHVKVDKYNSSNWLTDINCANPTNGETLELQSESGNIDTVPVCNFHYNRCN